MDDLPCLCSGGYRCNRCRARAWHDTWAPTRRRMRDNKLTAVARNDIGPGSVNDEQWCQQLYDHEADDLDLLLFEGEVS